MPKNPAPDDLRAGDPRGRAPLGRRGAGAAGALADVVGNVGGGTGLFALLAHAQVPQEL
jgi:hypothetical protein